MRSKLKKNKGKYYILIIKFYCFWFYCIRRPRESEAGHPRLPSTPATDRVYLFIFSPFENKPRNFIICLFIYYFYAPNFYRRQRSFLVLLYENKIMTNKHESSAGPNFSFAAANVAESPRASLSQCMWRLETSRVQGKLQVYGASTSSKFSESIPIDRPRKSEIVYRMDNFIFVSQYIRVYEQENNIILDCIVRVRVTRGFA